MANASIPYIIAEDGFYYVAYKEKVKVPEIVVSSKGVANGLSEEYNDGWDFGPDSYSPTSTSAIPYTQTVGIQEAINYIMSIEGGTIKFTSGVFDVTSAPFQDDGASFSTDQILVPENPTTNTIQINLIGEGVVSGLEEKEPLNAIASNSGTVIKSYAPAQPVNDPPYGSWILGSHYSSLTSTGANSVSIYIDGITFLTDVNSNVGGFNGQYFINVTGGSISAITNAPTTPTTLNSNPRGAIVLLHADEGQANLHFNFVKIEGFEYGLNYGGWLTITKLVVMYCKYGIYINSTGGDPQLGFISYVSCQMTNTMIYNTASTLILKIDALFLGDFTTDTSYPYYFENIVKSTGGLKANINVGSDGIGTLSNSLTDTDYVNFKVLENNYLTLSPTLSANPPASGTVYQNTNPYAIEIDLPAYASTSGTAGYVTVAKGSTDTPTAIANQYISGDTSDTSVDIVRLRVPAGWYYEFTASSVTFGTASVFAD